MGSMMASFAEGLSLADKVCGWGIPGTWEAMDGMEWDAMGCDGGTFYACDVM